MWENPLRYKRLIRTIFIEIVQEMTAIKMMLRIHVIGINIRLASNLSFCIIRKTNVISKIKYVRPC